MSQKTKVIILIIIILATIVGAGMYFISKSKSITWNSQVASIPQETQQVVVRDNQAVQAQSQSNQETIVKGKVRSINGRQVYIELADGKGSAINIFATTPVRIDGDTKMGNLSILKPAAMVSIKIDANSNAIEILIEK